VRKCYFCVALDGDRYVIDRYTYTVYYFNILYMYILHKVTYVYRPFKFPSNKRNGLDQLTTQVTLVMGFTSIYYLCYYYY